MTRKSLFGKYNTLLDESIQSFLSLVVSSIALFLGLNWKMALICFILGIFIDIDHLLNGIIARVCRIKNYKFDMHYGSKGHTIKLFHGIDVSLIFFLISYFVTHNFLFSSFIFINLVVHELWDFLVYPHSRKELFLFSRMKNKFNPGVRKKGVGLFFDVNSEKY